MNICLILHCKYDIGCFHFSHSRHVFQNIPIFLYTFYLLGNIAAKNIHQLCRIQLLQLRRFDHLSAIIQQKIKCICKYMRLSHIFLCNNICFPHTAFLLCCNFRQYNRKITGSQYELDKCRFVLGKLRKLSCIKQHFSHIINI